MGPSPKGRIFSGSERRCRASPVFRRRDGGLLRDDEGHLGTEEDSGLRFLGLSLEQFAGLFRTVGEVRAVVSDGSVAGFLWLELRERELHIHGIILLPDFRGRGLGGQAIASAQREFAGRIDVIELGVQLANTSAIGFYEHLGFVRHDTKTAPGFQIMRLPIR